MPQIIFATAFDQYAVRAFDVNAIDYLLKPFDRARVLQALERARAALAGSHQLENEPLAENGTAAEVTSSDARLDALLRLIEQQQGGGGLRPRSGKIILQAHSRLFLVDQKDICFAAIEEGTISVVTPTLEGHSKCRTIEELLELLDPSVFWRAHRSFVVNINHIKEVVPWFKSSYQLRMDDRKQTEIPVSRSPDPPPPRTLQALACPVTPSQRIWTGAPRSPKCTWAENDGRSPTIPPSTALSLGNGPLFTTSLSFLSSRVLARDLQFSGHLLEMLFSIEKQTARHPLEKSRKSVLSKRESNLSVASRRHLSSKRSDTSIWRKP